jgi:hypothetical protein
MPKTTHPKSSPLDLDLVDNTHVPFFPIPTRPEDSPVFKVSFDEYPGEDVSIINSTSFPGYRKPRQPIFPSTLDETYHIPSRPRGIYSADPWPVGFTQEEWPSVWESEPIKIDGFFRQTSKADPLKFHGTREDQFKGVPWRLTIEPQDNIPMFTHGQVLTYHDCNRRNRRYIIDHCYQDDITAYLRIICYVSRQEVCDAQSRYPPFILAIPREFSNVRTHPDFDIVTSTAINSDTAIFDSPPELPPAIPSYLTINEEETPSWIAKFCHLLSLFIC